MTDINNENNELIVDDDKELNSILQIRRDKLSALKESGNDPFQKVRFDFDTYSVDIKNNFDEYNEKDVKFAVLIMSRRDMVKANFIDVMDG